MPDIEKLIGFTITGIDVQKGAQDGTGFVYLDAVGADETPDVDDEIFDYGTSKPYVQAWSDSSAESTKAAGQAVSYGNIRAQHGKEGSENAAGTICEPIVFDDKQRAVKTRIKVVDSDAIKKVKEGVYRGLSVKGRLVGKKWRDGKYYRYTVDPVEFSLVDKPANPNATITVVKADGTTEVLKVAEGKKTKRVGGKDLPASSFAYVGDPERTETWKLPIHDAPHVRNALARLNQTEGIPSDKMAGVKKKIMRAAKRYGIDAKSIDEKETGKASGWAGTGMGSLGQLACLLDSLFYLRDTTLFEAEIEGDESDIPERLAELLETGGEILRDMTEEEVEEMIAMTETAKKSATSEELEKAAKSHFEKAKAAHEEMGKHLSGECKCAGMEKCAEKVASLHEKMADHFKGDGEAEKGDKQETEEEKKAREKKEAEAEEEKKKKEAKDKEKSASSDEIKELRATVAALTETIEKAAKDGWAKRPVPIHPSSRVAARDDGAPKDIVDKASEIKADDPNRVDKLYRLQLEVEPEVVKI